MAKTKKFKTESQQLLHLMTHSIYTQKEIFLRELIANASDAIDKRHYLSLTHTEIPSTEYEIWIEPNKEERTLVIKDNGIGFTEEELVNNLGTIAQSGSKAFREKLEQNDLDMIGQFGVGFYSAFMVASKVEVRTKSPFAETGYIWSSDGQSSYKIDEADFNEIGTEIKLFLNDDDLENDENYSEFLESYKIEDLVKKYSDYVRYPIKMMMTKKEEDKEFIEEETMNQMTPIWKRSKNEVTEEELNDFYKHQYSDYENPLKVIHTKVEGMLMYTALLFIPKRPPFDLYSEKYEKGLQLYSKGVFIQDKNKDLIPDYFKFVRGLVDSADLNLNISRELLQHDRQLKKIASHVEKKIKSELENMLKNERETYVEFYESYKNILKFGIYDQFGANKEKLVDLVMFKTSQSDDYVTFKEYFDRKPESQKAIYYAKGKSKESIMNLPQMDVMKDKGIEVLLFTDDIDEFMIQMINSYEEIPFKSVQQGEADFIDDEQKEDLKQKEEEHKDILNALTKALEGKVKEVKLSVRLKDSPVCLVSGEGLSMEMENILKQMPNNNDMMKAEKILEINAEHPLFKAVQKVYEKDETKIGGYASLLYHQAMLIEGLPIENPQEFNKNLVELMIDSAEK